MCFTPAQGLVRQFKNVTMHAPCYWHWFWLEHRKTSKSKSDVQLHEWMAKWYGVHVNKRWKDKHRWFNLILLCEILFHFVYTFSQSNRPTLLDSQIPCCVLSVTKESAREFFVSKYSFRMSIHLASWVVGVGKISGICWFECMCVGASAWYRAQHHIILQYTFWQQCSCCSIYLNVSLFKVVVLFFFCIFLCPCHSFSGWSNYDCVLQCFMFTTCQLPRILFT